MKTTYALVGMKHWHADALVRSLPAGEMLELRREPDNRHDANAVQVWARGRCVGYVGRGQREPTEAERAAGKKYVPGEENVPLARLMDSLTDAAMMCRLVPVWPPRVEVDESTKGEGDGENAG